MDKLYFLWKVNVIWYYCLCHNWKVCLQSRHLTCYFIDPFFILCIIMYILCQWHISSLQPFSLWKWFIKMVLYWFVNYMLLPSLWKIPHPFIWRSHCWWSAGLNLRLSGLFKWIHHSCWRIHLVFSFINNPDSRIHAKTGNTCWFKGWSHAKDVWECRNLMNVTFYTGSTAAKCNLFVPIYYYIIHIFFIYIIYIFWESDFTFSFHSQCFFFLFKP